MAFFSYNDDSFIKLTALALQKYPLLPIQCCMNAVKDSRNRLVGGMGVVNEGEERNEPVLQKMGLKWTMC